MPTNSMIEAPPLWRVACWAMSGTVSVRKSCIAKLNETNLLQEKHTEDGSEACQRTAKEARQKVGVISQKVISKDTWKFGGWMLK